MPQPPRIVRELENECEAALREIVESRFDDLPDATFHLMAKAAVTVLEASLDVEDRS